ncbi:ABC transporter substrate-binding protein [Sinomonas notoginsengisoli]|uniref:ABC transporter substrate-binding protein n=1 Tax=Sinomonas notoginsengisoli TaxID=1457311 RepID=UPI001F339F4F|nr:ABC transporter substrate-binding protein [Sinomonas notoginsengisoli]
MTVIDREPRHVATLGWSAQDICVELGVLPVSYAKATEPPGGTAPWFTNAVTAMDSLLPRSYSDESGLPLMDLRDIRPDLILAVNASFAQWAYPDLVQIAPTVAWPGRGKNTPWRESTSIVARALGKTAQGSELVSAVETTIHRAAANYPTLTGKTFLVVEASAAPGADFILHTRDSNAVRVIEDFGLVSSPALEGLIAQAVPSSSDRGPVTVRWPVDRSGELAADIVVVSCPKSDQETLRDNKVLRGIPAWGKQAIAVITQEVDMFSLVAASPTSVKWAVKTVMPALARCAWRSVQ